MEMSSMRGFYKIEDVLDDPDDWCGGTHPQLKVWIEDGDGIIALADATEPEDWDGTSPDEYERLEREVCGKIGADPESIEWNLK